MHQAFTEAVLTLSGKASYAHKPLAHPAVIGMFHWIVACSTKSCDVPMECVMFVVAPPI